MIKTKDEMIKLVEKSVIGDWRAEGVARKARGVREGLVAVDVPQLLLLLFAE
jgi:hypothetical protein